MIDGKDALEKAVSLFLQNGATCAVISDSEEFISHERGVKPLLSLVDEKRDVRGGAAADKVVGKAAAMLYILLGINALYACVISELAIDVLIANGIKVTYDKKVPMIRNRTDTGFCPMEQATKDIDDVKEALTAIRDTLKKLENSKK